MAVEVIHDGKHPLGCQDAVSAGTEISSARSTFSPAWWSTGIECCGMSIFGSGWLRFKGMIQSMVN